jgi:hypothetical protein
MRRIILISFVLISFVLILAAGFAPAQTAPATNWIKFVSTAGGFTAAFPVNPKETTETKTFPQGDVVSHMFLAVTNRFLCGVGYTDYPMDLDVERELALDRDNFAKEVTATVSTSQRTTFKRPSGDQLPALEFVAISDQGTFKGTVVLDHRRAYMAITFNRKDSDNTADIQRFFASFTLDK